LKVLHVINSLAVGGAERLVSELLPAQAAGGVDCRLLALDARGDAFSSILRERGIPVSFARGHGANPYSPLRAIDIAREIRQYKPDIVHAHLGPSFHWCAIAALVRPQTVLVATEHASANRRMSMPLAAEIERPLYRRYRRVAVVSRESGEALRLWLGMSRRKVSVIPNGIALERFARKQEAAADVVLALGDRHGIAMVARFVPAKDHATAIRAIASLPREYCLVLAGEGEEGPRLRALSKALGIGDRCLFLGSRDDVPSVLAACRAYLQSSRIEGFGIAALEAMAAGLPVAASDAPGLGDLVRGAGLLFSVGDEAACAAAIRSLVEDKELAAKLSAAGIERARLYSIEGCAARYEAFYRGAIGRER